MLRIAQQTRYGFPTSGYSYELQASVEHEITQ